MTSGRTTRRAGIRFVLALGAALSVLVMVAAASTAAEPTEATTFGADGIATPSLGLHFVRTGFSSVSARPDGGVVAQNGEDLESFLADGAPDPAMPPTTRAVPGTVFPADAGKSFVLAGEKLTRLDPDGAIDTSFGSAGTVKVPDSAKAATELASGKIALVTIELEGARDPQEYLGVTLLGPDGSPAGSDTFSSVVPPVYEETPVREIIPAPGGGALVVATNFIIELRPDGKVDPGFGEAGLLSSGGSVVGARFLPGGSIEAVGTSYLPAEKKEVPTLFRFTAAGAPEASFGDGGVRTFDLADSWGAGPALWGADGSVILGGRATVTGQCPRKECVEAPALIAFSAAGNLESGFGEAGVLRLAALAGPPQGYASSGVEALTRRPDGSIVAVGNAPPNETVAFLAALTPAGALIPTFGEGGIARVRVPVPATQRVETLAPLPDGGLLAAGWSDLGPVEEAPILVRYAADGSLDPSFGGGAGYVIPPGIHRAGGLAVRGDETVVGSESYPHSYLTMVRTGDGTAVSSFGSGGTVMLPRKVAAGAVTLARDGEPLVLGEFDRVSGERGVFVLRLGLDGRADPGFGHGGRVRLRPPGGGELKGGTVLAAAGGRILVGGWSGERFAIAALRPDGRLDRRFGSGGWSVAHAPGRILSMTLVRFGSRLYLAGIVGDGDRREHDRVVLMRLGADGHLDAGFGKHGRRVAPVASTSPVTAILPTPGGVVVTLKKAARPVLTFASGGAVRTRALAPQPARSEDVQATISAGRLVIGWSPYLERLEEDPDYHLSSAPIGPATK